MIKLKPSSKSHIIIFFIALITHCNSFSFATIEERFKQSVQGPKSSSSYQPEPLSLDGQISQYSKMHHSPHFTQMKGNPELDVTLIIKRDNKKESSVYFQGRQLSKHLLEVTVLHKGDHYNHAKQSIQIYIINTASKEIVLSGSVRHARLFQTDIDSDVYELRVSHSWAPPPSNASNKEAILQLEDELQKHIAIKMQIIDRNSSPKTQNSTADELMTRMKQLIGKQDKIFLDSLEGWDQVKNHQKMHQNSQENVYLNACLQILAIMMVYIVELLILRKMIKANSGVI